jgi:magnesium transporter
MSTDATPATRAYRAGVLIDQDFEVAAISDKLDDADTVVWVDYCAPTGAQLQELADELGLHELAVEDALGPHQRPKVDRYADHLFLSAFWLTMGPRSRSLDVVEVDAFVSRRWLVTVRESSDFELGPLVERWDRSPDLAAFGSAFLLYGLLDVIVDGYFEVVNAYDTYYDDVSEGIFSERPLVPAAQRDWFEMRRSMVQFHRLVVPMREAISALMRREHDNVPDELYPYYQDVYDHILRVCESSESLRDLVNAIVDTNLSLRDYRQNQIVKKVSSWAAIIAVPALVTGYYGMNVPFPGTGTTPGYISAAALMLGLVGALYLVFRRFDWL